MEELKSSISHIVKLMQDSEANLQEVKELLDISLCEHRWLVLSILKNALIGGEADDVSSD